MARLAQCHVDVGRQRAGIAQRGNDRPMLPQFIEVARSADPVLERPGHLSRLDTQPPAQ